MFLILLSLHTSQFTSEIYFCLVYLFNLTILFISDEDGQLQSLSDIGRLRFSHFNMHTVLANSTHLMASEGKEFDMEEDLSIGI